MRDSLPKLTTEAFARIVEQAIARIPEEIRRHLENILISVKAAARHRNAGRDGAGAR